MASIMSYIFPENNNMEDSVNEINYKIEELDNDFSNIKLTHIPKKIPEKMPNKIKRRGLGRIGAPGRIAS